MKKIQFLGLYLSHFLARYLSRPLPIAGDQKRHLPIIRGRQLAVGVIFLAVVFFLIKVAPGFFPKETVSEGIVGVYSHTNLPSSVANLISKPLVSIDKTGRPQPNLAEKWQVNNNATIYTFSLKKDLYWSDGSKAKSSDIKFNLPDVEVSYPNESTLEFKLADSFTPFPSLLTAPVFKGDSLLGVGGFRVEREERNHGLIKKLLLYPVSGGGLPIVSIRFYPDERTAKTAFELGEVESLIGFPDAVSLQGQPSVEFKRITGFNKLTAIFYNTKDPVLSDKNMRRALSAATPVIDGEEKAKTPVPSLSWAFNSDVKDLLGDHESAKSYLDKVQSGGDSTITLTTVPSLAFLGEKIVRSWKENGIQAVLRVESGIPQNFQALLLSESIPSDPDQYALWHSTQTNTNLSKYSSPRVDKDLEDGRKTGDLEKRKESYLDFQKVLIDDSPATFLYFPKTQVVYRKKVENNLSKILTLQFPQM
ncbi:hypothetical protein A3A14_03085 [Candidatus Daviesbacteria bacterium RIFCSPLOWO2_01_FULL_43_38]|uniref:Solute-binding protein family 5 domain-containing protein n=2 Tax=Candidatus Daviesiibacteriota TaxID=1752718 RepID=A0A1F5K134_9BACT|nr:MAG: Extracellular solute-binding protein family 5 [Candidatus Daviesbacteria bacterium GW2011_GWA2_42_7]OGE20049.1 MAG: hypothetical protein A2874_01035 [Candidatus Daviesbacteria bacterium RIFCSPHIGHO2_01_FULL_43_17]OGE34411.1 MAG: hypothetical protein A3E45_02960 [Candidatus Daviesbacteria bacterium RIFCSPHIGHO2_12_FULL_43_11]OGE63464.1 MAG: hypothetical protein A3A14_03085 [Candidatus Daviesbacteria bacterium RIFCSPLOWO2_01_FULL_43_38]OGE70811.1 MAG: hypothetical protein A3J21_00945 [Can